MHLQIDRQMPAGIEQPRAFDAHPFRARLQLVELGERLAQIFVGTENSDQTLHRVLQIVVNRVGILAAGPFKRRQRLALGLLDLRGIDRRRRRLASRTRAAASPARRPNTSKSESELPPSRFAPCKPPAASPAANSPGTEVCAVSASTRMPPIT